MSKQYSEAFVTALIASFMARDGKVSIDNKAVAKYCAMQAEHYTSSAIEHKTRDMKNKAKTLIATGDAAEYSPKTPRKRAASSPLNSSKKSSKRAKSIKEEQTSAEDESICKEQHDDDRLFEDAA